MPVDFTAYARPEGFSERTGISYTYYQAIETGVKEQLRISTLSYFPLFGGGGAVDFLQGGCKSVFQEVAVVE